MEGVIIRKIKTFIKIDKSTKLDFIEAYVYTGIARAFILFVPFNKLRKRIGKSKEESSTEVELIDYKIAKKISFVIDIASKYTPWQSKCLVQALAAQWMLSKRGISTTLYLGVRKEGKSIAAHAWLRCGKYFVTGEVNKWEFTVVAKFAKVIIK